MEVLLYYLSISSLNMTLVRSCCFLSLLFLCFFRFYFIFYLNYSLGISEGVVKKEGEQRLVLPSVSLSVLYIPIPSRIKKGRDLPSLSPPLYSLFCLYFLLLPNMRLLCRKYNLIFTSRSLYLIPKHTHPYPICYITLIILHVMCLL
uniref:Uncharacterized protein n=1 Tax=Cacopsylla melanoneura TaxID=428564 RepID=A0A8D9EK46_9HEMI